MKKLFTPAYIGPVQLRNRTIRSAAFEGMGRDNNPTQELKDYHVSVAKGGVGMTTLAYASVSRSGISFKTQLWLRPEIVDSLHDITDDIHAAGAKASIQLGHCGNMTHYATTGCIPVGASNGINPYAYTVVRGLRKDEIRTIARDFGKGVRLARDAGFDCVEVHAGHGYLISQFLSPYTNKRRDEYGGSLENRMRFMRECMDEVMKAAGSDMGIVVKMNMRDGFRSGMQIDESIQVAHALKDSGAHALVLSGGFVSKAPMYVMRGRMPMYTMSHYMSPWWLKYGVRYFGKFLVPDEKYKELYFLDDARLFRKELDMPLIYVGGASTRESIDKVLDEEGFEFVQMARSLIQDPEFVNHLREGDPGGGCDHVNYCIARMYSKDMKCHQHCHNLPKKVLKEIERVKEENGRNQKA